MPTSGSTSGTSLLMTSYVGTLRRSEEQACDRLLELHNACHHHGAPRQIRKGYTPVLDCHTSHTACNFDKLQKLNRQMGKGPEAEPEYIKNGDSMLVFVSLRSAVG